MSPSLDLQMSKNLHVMKKKQAVMFVIRTIIIDEAIKGCVSYDGLDLSIHNWLSSHQILYVIDLNEWSVAHAQTRPFWIRNRNLIPGPRSFVEATPHLYELVSANAAVAGRGMCTLAVDTHRGARREAVTKTHRSAALHTAARVARRA